jgi:hypothetical protein
MKRLTVAREVTRLTTRLAFDIGGVTRSGAIDSLVAFALATAAGFNGTLIAWQW